MSVLLCTICAYSIAIYIYVFTHTHILACFIACTCSAVLFICSHTDPLVCVMSGYVSKHSVIFLVHFRAAPDERSLEKPAFLYTLGCFWNFRIVRTRGDAGEVKEEDSVVIQGGLAEVQDLLYTFSRFYLFKACIQFTPHLFLHSYLKWKKSAFVFHQSQSEDVTVAPVSKVIPPHPDDIMVLICGPLHRTLLQGGKLQSRGRTAGERDATGCK